jgi:hypothetical protein
MTLNLDELESIAKAATPGPWKSAHVKGHAFDQVFAEVNGGDFLCDVYGKTSVDAAYIAAANPETMLALVAHIRKLEEMNERQRARETRLVGALVSIEEYWNREPTDGAMLDALDVMTRRARAAIEEVNRE